VIALIGFVWLVRDRHRLESRMILSCVAGAIVLLGYSYVVQTGMAQSVGRHGIVPGHHFVYYLRAFEAIAFGLGLRTLVGWLQHRRAGTDGHRSWLDADAAWLVLLMAVAAIVVWRYPSYAARSDFVFERRVAERNFSDPSLRQLYVWLREHTSPQDVVLAPINTGQYVVGVAGRKVVVVDKLFSNPYVDWRGRATDRDVMEKALADGDWNSFLEIASRHKVRYLLRRGELTASPNAQLLSNVWAQGEWVLYRLGS
jgi:hypothetical protein